MVPQGEDCGSTVSFPINSGGTSVGGCSLRREVADGSRAKAEASECWEMVDGAGPACDAEGGKLCVIQDVQYIIPVYIYNMYT